MPAKDVYRQGSQCGFNPKRLRSDARRQQDRRSHKSAGFGNDGCWQWYTRAQRQLLLDRLREDQARQAEWDGVPAAAATAGDQILVNVPAGEFPASHLSASIAAGLTYDPATASRRPVIRTLNAKK